MCVFNCTWHLHLAHSLPILCVLLPKTHAFDSIACLTAPFQVAGLTVKRQHAFWSNWTSCQMKRKGCAAVRIIGTQWNTMRCILDYIHISHWIHCVWFSMSLWSIAHPQPKRLQLTMHTEASRASPARCGSEPTWAAGLGREGWLAGCLAARAAGICQVPHSIMIQHIMI